MLPSVKPLKRSQAQEKRIAGDIGGRVTPGSGNGWVRKNDVRSSRYSVEAKYTSAKQFTLKLEDLLKAEKYAMADGRDMLFCIEMGGRDWCVISSDLLLELLDKDD